MMSIRVSDLTMEQLLAIMRAEIEKLLDKREESPAENDDIYELGDFSDFPVRSVGK